MERTIKTVKALLTDTSNPHLALLSYRATPLPWCNISPAELLFGRKIATDLPQPDTQLSPDWPYLKAFQTADGAQFNRRHRTRPLPELPPRTLVWVRTGKQQVPGQVIAKTIVPRSYIVETATGRKRRNWHHLKPRLKNSGKTDNGHFRFDLPVPHTISPEGSPAAEPSVDTPRSPIRTRSVTGTAIRLPCRYT